MKTTTSQTDKQQPLRKFKKAFKKLRNKVYGSMDHDTFVEHSFNEPFITSLESSYHISSMIDCF